jgi:hypothetical protein
VFLAGSAINLTKEEQMRKAQKYSLAVAATFLLASCGGGGGGDGGSPAATRAEGVYEGSTSTGNQFQALVLEDDQFWALYGTSSGGTLFVSGFIQGQGVSNAGTFTSSSVKDFGFAPPVSGTLTGTYSSAGTLSGTLSSSSGSSTFSGTAIPAGRFDYNAPASLSSIAGAWTLTPLDGSTASLTIAPSGTLSGVSRGCSFAGLMSPRNSGKNVFNFSLTFGPSPCLLPGQSATGIAVTYLVNGGPTRQLIVAGVDSNRNNGTALFGVR